jgi:hypothetical protein
MSADDLQVLHVGGKSDQCRAMCVAMNRRLHARSLVDREVKVYDGDMTLTPDILDSVITCAWALGANRSTLDLMEREARVPVGVTRMIRHPRGRSTGQVTLGQQRVAAMRKARKARAAQADNASAKRKAIVAAAKQAKANYNMRPLAYHSLAGGTPSTVIMEPTPRNWRSDCSQFAVNCYRHAGVPCPGSGTYLFSNTISIEGRGAKVTLSPRPGDLGMYGRHGATHHVEVYIGEPGCMFIGHGSPPIDSVTPGWPDFFLTFDSLEDS